ncbi:chemotaxis protein CheD [Shouchella clausii]|uniref:chemotaxis protein CheD n=1 Tax=Shouchella tritolerans TaxID=2979466 RepID=UPI001B2C75CF|nr:chemotaxis protein CheD [Shouchella tritolerans]GIN11205.1 chemotaxis protein CheD [Shouchella clausii]
MTKGETISIGEWKIVKGEGVLRTCGLGSCIGIVLYDQERFIAGMVHVMLPDSTKARKGANPWRYADTAIASLQAELKKQGARNLCAKMAGGAQMFKHAVKREFMQIGERNAAAARETFARLGITLVAEDTGGTKGRTIQYDVKTGELAVRTVHHGQMIL